MASGDQRQYFLDGLRGWAALAVVFWHLFVEGFCYSPQAHQILQYVMPINGQMAVFLFFIISGFTLSTHFIATGEWTRLKRMAVGRYFRLVIPIFAICLIAHLLMMTGGIPETRPGQLNALLHFTPTWQHLLRFSLWDVFFHFRFEEAYVPPLWTMGPELFGSMLVFTLLLFQSRSWRWLVYGLAFLVPLWAHLSFSLFVAGLLLANLYALPMRRPRGMSGLLCLFLLIAFFVPYFSYNQQTIFSLLGAIGLFAALVWLRPCRRFLENPLSRFLGRISFALYLVHVVLMHSVAAWLHFFADAHYPEHPGSSMLVISTLTLMLSILLAIPFARVDRFSVRASHRIAQRILHIGSVWRCR